jgi:hypothetical protein
MSPPLVVSLGDIDVVTPVISSNAADYEVQGSMITITSIVASKGTDHLILPISGFLN